MGRSQLVGKVWILIKFTISFTMIKKPNLENEASFDNGGFAVCKFEYCKINV